MDVKNVNIIAPLKIKFSNIKDIRKRRGDTNVK
jgi:hypothetical protein